MNCKDFLERLDAYLDAEMSQPERQAFLSHAQNCSSCREELRRAEAIRDALAHMNDGLSVPLAALMIPMNQQTTRKIQPTKATIQPKMGMMATTPSTTPANQITRD